MPVRNVVKLANVLSDETRYSIYRHLFYSTANRVTVQDVAREFSIHPNVARMHLEKLLEAGLVEASLEKPGSSGGRPARAYGLADYAIGFHFPPRNYRLLSIIAIEALATMGEAGAETLSNAAFAYGSSTAQKYLANNGFSGVEKPDSQLLESLNDLLGNMDLRPAVHREVEGFTLFIRHCTFKEVAREHPDLVCRLHRSFLQGIIATFYGPVVLEDNGCALHGADACSYRVRFLHE